MILSKSDWPVQYVCDGWPDLKSLSASCLTIAGDVIALPHMKTNFLAVLALVAVVAVGCVDTAGGRKTTAVPWVKDRFESRYERPFGQVFQAAKEVVALNGTLLNESTIHGTNTMYALEGRVNQRNVWISTEQVDPKVTVVVVQARTKGGGTDLDLCRELDKQIALKLVR